jgi:hypothetical protein
MRPPPWHKDEIAVCARVYRRKGAKGAQAALAAAGWERSWAAIRNKMKKVLVQREGRK